MTWKIFDILVSEEDHVIVEADSFEEALEIARRENPTYNAGIIIKNV